MVIKQLGEFTSPAHNEVKMIFFGAPGADKSTRSERAEICPNRCTDKKNHLSQSRGGHCEKGAVAEPRARHRDGQKWGATVEQGRGRRRSPLFEISRLWISKTRSERSPFFLPRADKNGPNRSPLIGGWLDIARHGLQTWWRWLANPPMWGVFGTRR